MPRVTVVPQSAVKVSFTRGGSALTVYSDSTYETTVSQPATITSTTTYYVPNSGLAKVVATDLADAALATITVDLLHGIQVFANLPAPSVPQLASLFDANSILAANSDNSPAPLTVAEGTLVGRATGGSIAALTAAQVQNVLSTAGPVGSNIAVGESTIPRSSATSTTTALTSGILYLCAFTAQKTEAVSSLTVATGAQAAAATPTLCKLAFFQVGGSGALTDGLTLLGVTANDTALFAAQNSRYTRSLVTPTAKVAGVRYAIGILVVSATTMPAMAGASGFAVVLNDITPWASAQLSGQTDISGDVSATLTAGARFIYASTAP